MFISTTLNLDEDTRGLLVNINHEIEINSMSPSLKMIKSTRPITVEPNQPHRELRHSDHTYVSNDLNNLSEIKFLYEKFKEKFEELQEKLISTRTTVSILENNNKILETENQRLQEIITENNIIISEEKFSLSNISKCNDMLRFYTGFSSLNDFDILYKHIEPELPNLSLYNKGSGYVRKSKRGEATLAGRPMALEFKEQLFLILCKLKAGLLDQDLAFRFKISLTTVSNYFTTWLDLLFKLVTKIPIWPSRKLVDESMPKELKDKFPSTRVIVNYTEFFIENPSDYGTKCYTCSNYKRHNTAKGFIGISPNGFVSYISPLELGRISNTELTLKCGLIKKLEKGDSVIADREFLIYDALAEKDVALNMPPFLNEKYQLSLTEEFQTKDIAMVRIHVERVRKRLKSFRVFKYIFPNSMHASLEKIWVICCYLLNFCNEPLLDQNTESNAFLT